MIRCKRNEIRCILLCANMIMYHMMQGSLNNRLKVDFRPYEPRIMFEHKRVMAKWHKDDSNI